jgi:very-short-patch-repair endonuclease
MQESETPSSPFGGAEVAHSRAEFEKLSDLGLFGGDTLEGLQKLRTRLLDLTRNNRLLNFKHTKQSLRFVDRKPDSLYQQILENESGLKVLPVPELDSSKLSTDELARYEQMSSVEKVKYAADKAGITVSYELPTALEPDQDKESSIQTLLFPEDLEATLQTIRSKTRLAIEETGSNFLHLAFGFLEWYESDSSNEPNVAPLVLLPVEVAQTLNSRTRLYEYKLSYTGEELIPNHSLIQKLRSDFGMDLRPPSESEAPETYWEACAQTIETHKHWRILRWASLGLCQFRKLLMYQDLDPAKWPAGDPLTANKKIKEFFEGQRQADGPVSHDFAIDELPVDERDMLLIEDADCSQHSALVDAMRGKDLVIQGPPGTGKSQTITNLICLALLQGKSVLFVSEKLAALEVVKNRLDKAGLGHFCLELHSEKTKKQTIFKSFDQRIKGRFPQPKDYGVAQGHLRARWQQLKELVEILSETEPSSGKTIHEILHMAAESRSGLEASFPSLMNVLEKLALIQKVSLPPIRHFEILHEVTNLESIAASICKQGTNISGNPWFGVCALATQSLPRVVIDLLQNLLSSIDKLEKVMASLDSQLGQAKATPRDIDSAERIVYFATLLENSGAPLPFDFFPGLSEFGEQAFEKLADSLEELQKVENELLDVQFLSDISELSRDQIANAAARLQELMKDGRMTLFELSEIRNRLRLLLDAQPDLLQVIEHLERAFSFTFSLRSFDLDLLIQLVSILSAAPIDLWASFDPALHKPALSELLDRVTEQADCLAKEEADLSEKFYLDRIPSTDQLLYDSNALGRTNVFSFLSRNWKEAWQRFILLKKNKAERFKPKDAALYLERLASHLAASAGFEKNQEFSEKLGTLFKGQRTDFAACRRLVEWLKQLDSSLPRSLSTTTRRCRETILYLDRRDVSELSAFCSPTMVDLLVEFRRFKENELKQTSLRVSENIRIEQALSILRSLSDGLDTNLDICFEALGRNDILLGQLYELHLLLARKRNVLKSIDASNPRSLLGDECSTCPTDGSRIRSKLEIWKRIRSLAPSDIFLKFVVAASKADDLRPLILVIAEMKGELESLETRLVEFGDIAKVDFVKWAKKPRSLLELRSATKASLDSAHQLEPWLQLNSARASLSESNLKTIFALTEEGEAPLSALTLIVDYFTWVPLAESLISRHVRLNQPGTNWDNIRRDFQRLDRELQALNRQLLASVLANREVPAGIAAAKVRDKTDLAYIQHQITLKRPSGTIRDTMAKAGAAVMALKPCLMMSPMAVSQFLLRGQFKFDLLIIDEASQMRPEDALGAIARTKQCVVVGDSNQLPPTAFFERLDLEAESKSDDAVIHESESILEAAAGLYQPSRMLKWHYRSQHESLISFSNAEFYDNSLVVFPSPHDKSPQYGVKFHKIDGRFAGGKNEIEAQIIVHAALTHLRKGTGTTLGIVAMNREQANLIEDLFEKSLKGDPAALRERGRLDERHERVFVKNLENVQGDERDVIFISITYGPDKDGVVKKFFGPINLGTGWRRLNVLFTRARKRVEVFSSMTDHDLAIKREDSRGASSLRNYLEFARTGKLTSVRITDRPSGSAFEDQVKNALLQKGYECEIQLGVANYFLDIAVRNPKRPASFLLGIECDGATYHSHKSARDRDRIRTEVLTNMNWRIHRVWSTDWFRNPKHQLDQILQAIEIAQHAADQEPVVEPEYIEEESNSEAERLVQVGTSELGTVEHILEASESAAGDSEAESKQDLGGKQSITELDQISADAWFRLAKWAKQKDHLTPWQRSLAYSLGRLSAVGRPPSSKQAPYAAAILAEARRLGFDPRSADASY